MPLSQQQLEKIQSWFDSLAFTVKCPVCEGEDRDINDLVEFPVIDPNTGAHMYLKPLVSVTCTICAHVFLFDAAGLGLRPASPSDPPAGLG